MSDPTATQDLIKGAGEPTASPVAVRGDRRSLWRDTWDILKRRKIFWISFVMLIVFLLMAAFPTLFTHKDPEYATLAKSMEGPSADAWFGYDLQGRDVFARSVYGARTSIIVGVLATLATVLLGGLTGVLAAYFGRWIDAVVSRVGEMFLGLPYVLGAIIILGTVTPAQSNPGKAMIMAVVIIVLALLGWPILMRIARSAVIQAKHQDYVQAARALGAGPLRLIFRHLLPNSLAPILVYTTITIGSYIGAEATLSLLGIGLRPPVISWGIAIADHASYMRTGAHALLFPAAFLSLCVLTFVMLGEAVRDALDPKLR
ncbi:oligopeptide transport system permease protein [Microbispora rosea]|uniref:Oligopeptide transport system permease protein n=1 Tax=Microbispora rosea TaxID=58117 RepID=A0A1N7FRL9_9ACTN|nr:ABC transporter permease [Microbispora rosea]GIH50839.1 peptide ABC transporter permease [Microbispora rosea subsp. rosea]SIS02937.1 oligopeptide transport system permease protein [Microbispora rosea]